MAHTLELGTGSNSADSFASVAEARVYAGSRGLTLPVADADVEVLLRRAVDYFDTFESMLRGKRLNYDQTLPFPRIDCFLYGVRIASSAIPAGIKSAQCQAACDLVDNDPQAIGSGREVLHSAVGPIVTTYAQTGTRAVLPVLTKVNDMLKPFLTQTGYTLTAHRA